MRKILDDMKYGLLSGLGIGNGKLSGSVINCWLVSILSGCLGELKFRMETNICTCV
jgi:hypothetical protein